jgi:hypothetical protein
MMRARICTSQLLLVRYCALAGSLRPASAALRHSPQYRDGKLKAASAKDIAAALAAQGEDPGRVAEMLLRQRLLAPAAASDAAFDAASSSQLFQLTKHARERARL